MIRACIRARARVCRVQFVVSLVSPEYFFFICSTVSLLNKKKLNKRGRGERERGEREGERGRGRGR